METSHLSSNDEELRLALARVPEGDCSAEADLLETENERRCLVLGKLVPRSKMVRFVLGPDNQIVPDISEKLPGRGFWVSATREALEQTVSKQLFKRAAKKPVNVAPDLVDQVQKLLTRRCLDLLGLARSAGCVVVGQAGVEEESEKRHLTCLLASSDAGQDGLKKLSRTDILRSGFTREELGAALGRDHAVYLGLRYHALADKLKAELIRHAGVTSDLMDETKDEQAGRKK